MNRPPLRTIKKQKEFNAEQRYNDQLIRYISGQFTYDCHCLIQKLVEKGRKQPHMQGVQLYRILMDVTKILMLNELQILFLGATVQEMNWKVIDSSLNPYIDDFRGLNARLKTDIYSKKMQLSLLLIAYIVKLYLNEQMNIFESKMRKIIPNNYDKMYQDWVQKMKKNFKFSPKNMNKLFRQLDIVRVKREQELEEVNYNMKVEELFTKLIEYQPKDNHRQVVKESQSVPIQEQEQEDHAGGLPSDIIRRESLHSLRSFGQRQSFNQLLNRRDHSFLRHNQNSFLRNNSSMDDFMGDGNL